MGLYDAAWSVTVRNESKYTIKFNGKEGVDWMTAPRAGTTLPPNAGLVLFASTAWDNSNAWASSYNNLYFEIPGYPHRSYFAIFVHCYCDMTRVHNYRCRAGWVPQDHDLLNSGTGGITDENLFNSVNVVIKTEDTGSGSQRASMTIDFKGDDFGSNKD